MATQARFGFLGSILLRRRSLKYGISQHLRQVRFNKGCRLIHNVVEQPVRPLVNKATVHNLPAELREALPVTLAFLGQTLDRAREPCCRPCSRGAAAA